MVKKIGGSRKKTRGLLKKKVRNRGKMSLSKFFQDFKSGDKVRLVMDSTYQKGAFEPRFFGKIGTIIGKQGKCYKIDFKDYTKKKILIVHPIHLRKA